MRVHGSPPHVRCCALLLAGAAAVALAACPAWGTYACATSDDCAVGWSCQQGACQREGAVVGGQVSSSSQGGSSTSLADSAGSSSTGMTTSSPGSSSNGAASSAATSMGSGASSSSSAASSLDHSSSSAVTASSNPGSSTAGTSVLSSSSLAGSSSVPASSSLDPCATGALDTDMDGTRDCDDLCPRDPAVVVACPFKTLTVQETYVDAPLVDFPVLVRLVDMDLTRARADGGDIFFAQDAFGQLPLDAQVEVWDQPSGTLVAWVRLPAVQDNAPTTFYLRFGDGRANGHRNPQGVWQADFRAVFHMDSGGGAATQMDSSSAANHAAPDGAGCQPDLQVNGMVGTALTFGAAGCDRLVAPDSASLDLSAGLTISAWVRPTTGGVAASEVVLSKRVRTLEQANYQAGFSSVHNMYFMWGGAPGNYPSIASSPAATVLNAAWSHVVWTVQGSPLALRTYLNGQRINAMDQNISNSGNPAGSQLALVPNNHPLFVGGMDQETDEVFHGDLDEVRLSGTSRSAAWVRAEFENQRQGSTFLVVGP